MLKPKTLHASTFHFYLERVSENWEQSCLPEAWTGSLGTSRALPSGALLAWGPLCRPRVGCGKGPGLWVQIPVLPQPWSANDLQNEEKSPSTRGDPHCRRAGDGREQGVHWRAPLQKDPDLEHAGCLDPGAWTGGAYGEKCLRASLQLRME